MPRPWPYHRHLDAAFLSCTLIFSPCALPQALADSPEVIAIRHFETHVRPIFAEHCASCHGPDRQHASLRLDHPNAVSRGSDSGQVILPGQPDTSKLALAIQHADGAPAMPEDAPKLSQAKIDHVRQWIADGAPWPASATDAPDPAQAALSHWAYQPLRSPHLPSHTDPAWSSHPIDQLVFAQALHHQISPAPPADPKTLLRRLHHTLTGLNPSPEQLDAFARDPSPHALTQAVDALLADPAYAERWARHWLDLARYADTMGYNFTSSNRYPYAYTYRDWVVAALADDLPYHQFIHFQLAADHLVDPSSDQRAHLAALGFLTTGPRGGLNHHERIDDHIDVTTRGLLATTTSCARCHDHKSDPIPTSDYYALYGIFNSSHEPAELPLIGEPNPGPEVDHYHQQRQAIEDELAAFRLRVWTEIRSPESVANALAVVTSHHADPEAFERAVAQHSLRPNFAKLLNDLLQPAIGNPAEAHPAARAFAALAAGDAPFPERLAALAALAAEDPAQAGLPIPLQAILDAAPQDAGALFQTFATTLLAHAPGPDGQPASDDPFAQWLANAPSPLAIGTARATELFHRQDTDAYNPIRNKLADLEASSPGAPHRAMALVDKPDPGNSHVFLRGDPGRRGEVAPRAFLSFLGGGEFSQGSGRLELAQAITDPDRGGALAARTIVNRVWNWHFGKPIVPATSDFGLHTPPPPHLDLLDHLAHWFVHEAGWSLKALHHHILSSHTFQLSSLPPDPSADPEHKLFTSYPRRRLDFESLRDNILLAAGNLDLSPAARTGRPSSLDSTRRTLFAHVDRYQLDPLRSTFDFPNPDHHSDTRHQTIVPQQPLYLMNGPFTASMAGRIVSSDGFQALDDHPARVAALFRQILLRDPAPDELAASLAFVEDATSRLTDDARSGPWAFGHATFSPASDAAPAALADFHPFTHFDPAHARWQFTSSYPGPAPHNYVAFSRSSHHPGDGSLALAFQWTAGQATQVRPAGRARHTGQADASDGLDLYLFSSLHGLLSSWHLGPGGEIPTTHPPIDVTQGETLTFVAHCRAHPNHDSFEWQPRLFQPGSAAEGEEQVISHSKDHFPPPPGPSPFALLAQALFASNEFNHID
jgi:hypothetical protein